MSMTAEIRFRVPPKLRRRAEKVVKLRSVGKVKCETISDFGRDSFLKRLEAEEQALSLIPEASA